MSTEGFVSFLQGMGHTVRHVNGLYWYNEHPHVYTCFPFDRLVDMKRHTTGVVLGRDGWVARFPCEAGYGRSSYRLICTSADYELSHLGTKARNQTRRGLEQCTVRQISFEELSKDGPKLNSETLVRQGRRLPPDFYSYWQRYYKLASRSEGAHAWGAFVGTELAAYLISFEMEDVMNVFIVRSSSRFLKHYPNNALYYRYLEDSLCIKKHKEVSVGYESIRKDLASLDHFKIGMGFSPFPVCQRIELSPLLKSVLRRSVLNAILATTSLWRYGEKMNKLGGMLTWYRDQVSLP